MPKTVNQDPLEIYEILNRNRFLIAHDDFSVKISHADHPKFWLRVETDHEFCIPVTDLFASSVTIKDIALALNYSVFIGGYPSTFPIFLSNISRDINNIAGNYEILLKGIIDIYATQNNLTVKSWQTHQKQNKLNIYIKFATKRNP